jgi:SMP-30/Gluconolactonase/LRE-like region
MGLCFPRAAEEQGYPDGSTVDSDGCPWNAEWGGGRVVRYTPEERLDRVVAIPCSQADTLRLWRARPFHALCDERPHRPQRSQARRRAKMLQILEMPPAAERDVAR